MIVKKQKRAAKILRITPQTLRRWRKMKGFPNDPHGFYDTGQIGRWRRTRKLFTDEELDDLIRDFDNEWPAARRRILRETFDETIDLELPPDVESPHVEPTADQ
ncbi:MAG: hypothetical protein WEB58_10920 [Planctomycetaceae bacterium]